jgi:hypothetical protein
MKLSALRHTLTHTFQACFLYLFHNGQFSYSADESEAERRTFCQAQPWNRSIVRSNCHAGASPCYAHDYCAQKALALLLLHAILDFLIVLSFS